jgi:uncharacterized protein (DUF302 family)
MTINYGFGKVITMDFEQAVNATIEALNTEGFGVLTDIDVQATLKKKLGKDMPPYRILGACNPPLAHQALTADPSIGLLLPCNVVVRRDDTGTVYVEFMNPQAVLDLVDNPDVHVLASMVRERLDRVLAAL